MVAARPGPRPAAQRRSPPAARRSCALGVGAPEPGALAAAIGGGAAAPGADGLTAALAALVTRDVGLARRAGLELVGRGDGLTPAGDDFLAGIAVTVAAAGEAAGFAAAHRAALA